MKRIDTGVLIVNNLKLNKQTVSGKSVLGLMKKSFAVLDKRTSLLLYKSLGIWCSG